MEIELYDVKLVPLDGEMARIGLGLCERLRRWVAGQHRRTVVSRLRRFRQTLKEEMGAEELWTALRAPAVLLLADVCEALELDEYERAAILGEDGEREFAHVLGMHARLRKEKETANDRQARALEAAEQYGVINLSIYRDLCPYWSDETLRLDLVELAGVALLRAGPALPGAKAGGVGKVPGRVHCRLIATCNLFTYGLPPQTHLRPTP